MKFSMIIVQKPNTHILMRLRVSPNCGMKKQEPMMMKSTKMSTVPSDQGLYLLIEAAMMSVPPVEPLKRNTMPRAVPVIRQPMTSDMKSCPSPRILCISPVGVTGASSFISPSRKVSMRMA